MAFWDSIKKAGTSAKCFAGMHAGDFKPALGKPKCYEEKVCPDCSKHIENVVHKFVNNQYISESKCDLKSTCKHCDEERVIEKHTYEYRQTGCDHYKVCSRCGIKNFIKTKHNWVQGPVMKMGEDGRYCSDCRVNYR